MNESVNKIIANLTVKQIETIKTLPNEEKLYVFTHGKFKQEMIKEFSEEDQELLVNNNVFLNYNNNIKRDFINKNPKLGAKLIPSLLENNSEVASLTYFVEHPYILYEMLLYNPELKNNYKYLEESRYFWNDLATYLNGYFVSNKSREFFTHLDNLFSLARMLGFNSDEAYSKFLLVLLRNFNNIKKYEISEENQKVRSEVLDYYFNNWRFNSRIYKLFRNKTPEEERKFLMTIDFEFNTERDIRHVRVKHNKDLMMNIRTVMELKK